MTLEQQKLALAKAFPSVLFLANQTVKDCTVYYWSNPAPGVNGPINWPTEGLAVLHECCQKLSFEDGETFCRTLMHQLDGEWSFNNVPNNWYRIFDNVNASWEQRLEAMVRVKGLWVEGEV